MPIYMLIMRPESWNICSDRLALSVLEPMMHGVARDVRGQSSKRFCEIRHIAPNKGNFVIDSLADLEMIFGRHT
jgi:hypothetical protein